MKYLWGVDMGGTKIEGVILNAEKGEVLIRERVPTEAAKGYETILGQIDKLIHILKEKSGLEPSAIGFSTPGTTDPGTQTMKNSNATAINGKPFKKDLENLLKVRVEMANDANSFALAEATLGAARGMNAQVVFGVILGTGVGGGLIVNNKVINGKHGIAGEWGHNTFDDHGPDCYCGRKGCNETYFAGPALERYYERLSGIKRPLREINQRHKEGTDAHATQTIGYLTSSFARAISYIVNTIDPDVIVLGGGVSHIDELYTDTPEKLKDHIFNSRKVETLFLRPQLGDSAGVFGAAELVND